MKPVYVRTIAVTALSALAFFALTPAMAKVQARVPHHATLSWYASWAASPMNSHSFPTSVIAPTITTLSNQTLRQIVTISRGGAELRVRFSNEFGTTILHIGAASVGYQPPGATSMHRIPLTFGGVASVNVPPGAPIVSDPVALDVANGATLEINAYLPGSTPITTEHVLGLQQSYASGPGNYTMADTLPDPAPFEMVEVKSGKTFFARAFLSEVDVADKIPARTVIAFGDSITDGFHSTQDKNRRWPDYLSRRIAKAKLPLSVINEGIGGNQVIANGAGDSALTRFDRDALAIPGASTVILLEGINDIGFSGGLIPGLSRPDIIPAGDIIQGYRQLIARAHEKGLRIIGTTMTAFGGSPAFTPQKEAVREEVNKWIRTSHAFDGVVDFDRTTRDPQNPEQLRKEFDGGDHVHMSDKGYEAMADAIDLAMLK